VNENFMPINRNFHTSTCRRSSPVPGLLPSLLPKPRQVPCLRVVVQDFFEAMLSQARIIGSHAVVPCKQWFGQKPASVDSTCGLRYFNTGVA
jgi:hypothetical protein